MIFLNGLKYILGFTRYSQLPESECQARLSNDYLQQLLDRGEIEWSFLTPSFRFGKVKKNGAISFFYYKGAVNYKYWIILEQLENETRISCKNKFTLFRAQFPFEVIQVLLVIVTIIGLVFHHPEIYILSLVFSVTLFYVSARQHSFAALDLDKYLREFLDAKLIK